MLLRHALKNALIPTVTVVGLQVGYLLGGTVLTETVFARPGLGRLLVDSIARRDIAVVQTTIMLLSTTFVLVNLVVDLLYLKLDPRIRYD
jgi:peptide/nickel transport system permease protein